MAHLALVSLMMLPVFSQKLTTWWLDNLINLQLQWSILAVFLTLLGMKYIQHCTIPLSILYLVLVTYNFGPLYQTGGFEPAGRETLNIAQLNIKYGNPYIDNLVDEIAYSDYDIVLLQEIGDNDREILARLKEYFPHSVGAGRLENTASGMVLFSRWPIVNSKIHDLGYVEGKIIETIVQSPESTVPVHIFALHPGAPRSKVLWRLRNSTLGYVAHKVFASRLPHKIVIGDINTSPWSPEFKYLRNTSDLRNSAHGYGYIPSWSASSLNKFARLISSAYIDHCLVSNVFRIINKQSRPVSGSDHLLISTRLGLG